MKEYAEKFYKGKAWKKCRASYVSYRTGVDGGVCERCKGKLGYIVHHIKPITPQNIDNPLITLNHDNLMYVCKDCHEILHRPKTLTCAFDSFGNPIKKPPIEGNFFKDRETEG